MTWWRQTDKVKMMERLEQITGIVAPLNRANVDTDAIIPKQFLKSVKRTGFGPYLFDEWRYLDRGEPGMDCSQRPVNPDFVLNRPEYGDATVLLTRANFGCGSSREHAPWALLEYGFRVVIAPSFADIFYNNCFKNGILPVRLQAPEIDRLFEEVENIPGYRLTVDLQDQTVVAPDDRSISFHIDPFHRECLLNGFDDIGVTLQYIDRIKEYESRRRLEAPWLFVTEESVEENLPA